jgi:hypothetical protein
LGSIGSLDEILTARASVSTHQSRSQQDPRLDAIGECKYAGCQQQHDPASKKKPGEIDQVGVNKVNIHSRLTHLQMPSAGPSTDQLGFPGRAFVLVQDIANRIKPAERRQVSVGERLLNL